MTTCPFPKTRLDTAWKSRKNQQLLLPTMCLAPVLGAYIHMYVCTYVSVCAHVCVSTAKDICFSLEMLVQSVRNISLLVNIHTIMHTHTRTSTYYVSMLVCTDVLEIAWLHFISVFYSFAGPE